MSEVGAFVVLSICFFTLVALFVLDDDDRLDL